MPFIWTVGVSVLLYISVQKILRFSNPGPYFRGLPLEMLSMSFILFDSEYLLKKDSSGYLMAEMPSKGPEESFYDTILQE